MWPETLFRRTAASTAQRLRAGEDRRVAVAELLDEFAHRPPTLRAAAWSQEPTATGDGRCDALLPGLVEWLADRHGLPCPSWVHHPSRFLDQMGFVSPPPASGRRRWSRPRRRCVGAACFWPERSLVRV